MVSPPASTEKKLFILNEDGHAPLLHAPDARGRGNHAPRHACAHARGHQQYGHARVNGHGYKNLVSCELVESQKKRHRCGVPCIIAPALIAGSLRQPMVTKSGPQYRF